MDVEAPRCFNPVCDTRFVPQAFDRRACRECGEVFGTYRDPNDRCTRRVCSPQGHTGQCARPPLPDWITWQEISGFPPPGAEVVYFIMDDDYNPIYVGQTSNLLQRLGSHASKGWNIKYVRWLLYETREDAQDAEQIWIKRFSLSGSDLSNIRGNPLVAS